MPIGKREQREIVRAVEAAAEAVRQNEQRRTREARDKVRRLDDRERNEVPDEIGAAGAISGVAPEKRRIMPPMNVVSEKSAGPPPVPSRRDAGGARQSRSAARELVGGEQHERKREREEK